MRTAKTEATGFRFPVFQGLLPIKTSQVPVEIIAGITLAALAIPEVMGYTKISGTSAFSGTKAGVIAIQRTSIIPSEWRAHFLHRDWKPCF